MAYKKKVYKKRRQVRKYRPRKSVISRFPTSKTRLLKMRYTDVIALLPAAPDPPTYNVPYSYIYRANDVYDPDYAYGGHQPLYYDQMRLLFNHHTVIGSRINVRATLDNGSTIDRVIGITLADTGAIVGVGTTLREQPSSVTRIQSAADMRPVHLSKSFSSKKYFRNTDFSIIRGTGSVPIEVAYYHIWTYPSATGDAGKAVRLHIDIDYIVLWSEPKIVSGS